MSPILCPPQSGGNSSSSSTTNADAGMSAALKAKFEILKKRKLDENSAHQVAQETAHLVDNEIQRMRNSVAELEALLMARQNAETVCSAENGPDVGEDESDILLPKNQFPFLPPDVVAVPVAGRDDDTDDLDTTSCDDDIDDLDTTPCDDGSFEDVNGFEFNAEGRVEARQV